MKIKLTSLFVKDQDKALEFYTAILGFVKKTDIPGEESSRRYSIKRSCRSWKAYSTTAMNDSY